MPPIPPNSTVLVTGANGFIAAHIIDQLLSRGYRVRGTVRTEAKGGWAREYFEGKYGQGRFEVVVVPDMAVEGAFGGAVKGCSGIAHVASNMSFSPSPSLVIPGVIAGVTHTLRAAATEPSVKRFVFTSSSTAATSPIPNKRFTITSESWNDVAVENAWREGAEADPGNGRWVYAASKTQAERELWRFVREERPGFAVNAVLPNANFGRMLDAGEHGRTTARWIKGLYGRGEMDPGQVLVPPQWFVNVIDTALLHVAALTDPSVENERIFAFAEHFTWNKVLAACRKVAPDVTFPSDFEGSQDQDLSVVEGRGRAEELLRKVGGEGFVGLEESVGENLVGL